jgi:hypothetical protein
MSLNGARETGSTMTQPLPLTRGTSVFREGPSCGFGSAGCERRRQRAQRSSAEAERSCRLLGALRAQFSRPIANLADRLVSPPASLLRSANASGRMRSAGIWRARPSPLPPRLPPWLSRSPRGSDRTGRGGRPDARATFPPPSPARPRPRAATRPAGGGR